MPAESRRWLWIVLMIAASVLLNLMLTCATAFAALATLTALHMSWRDAVVVAVTAWLASQAVGFGLLGYPRDFSSYAWGVTLGVAGLVTLVAAYAIAGWLRRMGEIAVTVTAFAGVFVVYQAVLLLATAVLSSDPAHFAPAVVLDVLRVNAISLAVLLILHRLGMGIGLITRQSVPVRRPAA